MKATILLCEFRSCRKPASRKVGNADLCENCYRIVHDRFVDDIHRVAFKAWKQLENEHSSVYFVRRPDGLVKIGYSTNLKQRLSALKTEHGEVELLASLPGHRQAERYIHSRFRVESVGGEWFAPTAALYRFIDALRLNGPEAAFAAIDAVAITNITEATTEDLAWSYDRIRP